jgi:cell wall-associated NlpC family hydrolase
MSGVYQRLVPIASGALLFLSTVACIFSPTATNGNELAAFEPRWSCPTPQPLPTIQIEDGTKLNDLGTPEAQYRDTEPYEREYGRPVVRPTVYLRSGKDFFLGQIINLGGADVQLEIEEREERIPASETTPALRLAILRFTWNASTPFFFDPARQVVISAVTQPDGRQLGGEWHWTPEAAHLAGLEADQNLLRRQIDVGTTQLELPILIPEGTVAAADLRLDPPNTTIETAGSFRVQFSPGSDPFCSDAGTVGAVYSAEANEAMSVAVPPGTDGIVAKALSQVGRQYCWGGKGFQPCHGGGVTPACASLPCFDCSGLTWWAYKENGIPILHGTANQKNYPEVSKAQVQPGDLLLFGGINQFGRGAAITHVGIYAGDLDGDGTGDMIHSANYPDGVLIAKNAFGSPYYASRLAIITRPAR